MNASAPLMAPTQEEECRGGKGLASPQTRNSGYLTTPRPVWRDIVDAADWLRGEMGISRPLWGEACVAMGRECAAVAVALVSARPAEHFRTSPGGYFHGMVAREHAKLWGSLCGRCYRPVIIIYETKARIVLSKGLLECAVQHGGPNV